MIPTFSSNEDIRKHIERSGREFWTIGSAINGLPIYCAKVGGTRQPSVLITAGSHASEPAGVVGALKLLAELQSNLTVYVVPNRDPMGLEGYHRYLAYALGEEVTFENNAQLKALLKTRGQTVYEDQDLVLSAIGDLVFGAMEPSPEYLGPSEVWLRVKRLLVESQTLRVRLAGLRVVVPTNMPDSEGCGLFDRAYTCYVTKDGVLKNFNRLFGIPSAPQEIRCVQELMDQVKPGLSLDLHEGFGGGFYLIVPPFHGDRLAENIAAFMVNEAKDKGYRIYGLSELKKKFPDGGVNMRDIGEGVLEEEVSKSDMQETFMAYARSKYGLGFGVEAGRQATLERRGLLHFYAAQTAVRTFESAQSAG
jgi:hypothetical protein